jgi:hypothetical protein
MRLCSKLFLGLSAVLWGVSYTPFGSEMLYGIPKPLGAVFFGLFLISWILPQRDFQRFEEDQALRNQLIKNEKERRHRRQKHPAIRWKPREAYP